MLFITPQAESQTDTLSLRRAIDVAQQNNKTITISKIGIRASESRLREVRASRLPFLTFSTHYLHTPETGYNEIVTDGGQYGVQLTTSLPLYDGGVKSTMVEQAMNEQERSNVNLKKGSAEVSCNVRISYYSVLGANEELRIREETVGRLEEYHTFLEQLRLGGNASESDVLKARVDLNNAVIAVDQARQSVQRSKLMLLNALGGSFDENIEVVPVTAEDTASVPSFAIENNPDIQLLQYDRMSAVHEITIAKAERLPTLSIAGDVGLLGVKPDEYRDDFGYSILLTLEVPLFNWGSTHNRIEQKELAWELLDAQIQLQKRELETEWRILLTELEVTRKSLLNYAHNITEAEKNYLAAKSRFAGGNGSNLEVLDAQRLLVEAKLNYNTALFQLRTDLALALKLSGQS